MWPTGLSRISLVDGKMMMRRAILLVAMCLVSAPATAGAITWGVGALSCGAFVIAADGAKGDPIAMNDMYAMIHGPRAT